MMFRTKSFPFEGRLCWTAYRLIGSEICILQNFEYDEFKNANIFS